VLCQTTRKRREQKFSTFKTANQPTVSDRLSKSLSDLKSPDVERWEIPKNPDGRGKPSHRYQLKERVADIEATRSQRGRTLAGPQGLMGLAPLGTDTKEKIPGEDHPTYRSAKEFETTQSSKPGIQARGE
jgi:hypothetical protein